MKRTVTIPQYFLKATLRYAGLGLFLLCLISLGISFFLAREQMSSDLRESAVAAAQAFRDRIIEGDIRSVEPQLKQLLKIREGESAQILKPDLTRVYDTFSPTERVKACANIGVTCFEGYFGHARVFIPISLASGDGPADRYLYLSKRIDLNWGYLITVFVIFALGYLGLLIAFLRISKLTSTRLSSEILKWADRLKDDPKNPAPLTQIPFAELQPLREALEGLNAQIQHFEKTATDKARLLLLRGIAHDLLTPVARLQLYAGALENEIDCERHGDTLGEMRDALNLVIGIASQVKALNDLDTLVEKTELVAAAQQELKALRASESIESKAIEIKFSSTISNLISPFSRTEIARILSNLIQNAAYASRSGGVVSVEVGRAEGKAFLSVVDKGCGIPYEVQEPSEFGHYGHDPFARDGSCPCIEFYSLTTI